MGNDYYNDRMLCKWEDENLESKDDEDDYYKEINERLEYYEDFYCDEIKGIDC